MSFGDDFRIFRQIRHELVHILVKPLQAIGEGIFRGKIVVLSGSVTVVLTTLVKQNLTDHYNIMQAGKVSRMVKIYRKTSMRPWILNLQAFTLWRTGQSCSDGMLIV